MKNKILYYIKSLTVTFFLFVLTACANTNTHIRLYSGSQIKPEAEIVKLLLPSEIEIFDIDGEHPETPYIPDGYYRVDLLPGDHVITVQYKEVWGGSAYGSIIESKLFQFKYSMKAGEKYIFKHNGPTEVETADIQMEPSDIKIWLQEQNSSTLIQANRKGDKDSFLTHIGINFSNRETNAATSSEKSQFEQLKNAWMKADDKQRQAFKDWVSKRSIDGKGL